ncbi:pirin family protein [Noviherbaspirillum sp.]|uniref:pirin family protein n=1 Tax=Noviherbaspirillum sp. TaxID=1926288 RepID=UPI002FE394EF
MIELRRSEDRGHANHGWLDSHFSFSFADYYDPENMGFGPLRVINDDRIAGGTGFGMHGHRDMEIISYVLEGELAHKDSMGNGSVIRPGDVQRMSAGTGVRHSEFNHAQDRETHLLQIWIEPNRRGIPPGYEEKHFDEAEKRGRLRLIASPDGRDGSVTINQNATVHVGLFDGDEHADLPIEPGRKAYVHVARGAVTVNGTELKAGDALKAVDEAQIRIADGKQAEVLVFDLV